MKNRIIGFDLARAYAIFGMFIVNFNTVFGSHTNTNGLSGFLNLFNGNSSSLFVILAGMGVSLLVSKATSPEERRNTRKIISKRAWFLFFLGVVFYNWWPADILHFYGGYMHLAVFMLFVPRIYYIWAALICIVVFHGLLFIIPFDTGWDFSNFLYKDFWTVSGFIRNTLYNGWNPIFPWMAYFFLGMYLGKLDWQNKSIHRKATLISGAIFLIFFLTKEFAGTITSDKDLQFFLTADYLPPFFPFIASTASYGVLIICLFVYLGEKTQHYQLSAILASTGQLTLTHYLSHLTLGFISLSLITGKELNFDLIHATPTAPWILLVFAVCYFILSCAFSYQWKKRFKNGPVESLMRKISG